MHFFPFTAYAHNGYNGVPSCWVILTMNHCCFGCHRSSPPRTFPSASFFPSISGPLLFLVPACAKKGKIWRLHLRTGRLQNCHCLALVLLFSVPARNLQGHVVQALAIDPGGGWNASVLLATYSFFQPRFLPAPSSKHRCRHEWSTRPTSQDRLGPCIQKLTAPILACHPRGWCNHGSSLLALLARCTLFFGWWAHIRCSPHLPQASPQCSDCRPTWVFRKHREDSGRQRSQYHCHICGGRHLHLKPAFFRAVVALYWDAPRPYGWWQRFSRVLCQNHGSSLWGGPFGRCIFGPKVS